MKREKRSKYDTNPLDTDYARRADEVWAEPDAAAKTAKKVEERWDAEAPTRRYDSSIPVSYPSIHVPPTYPPKVAGEARGIASSDSAPPSERSIPGLGLPENATFALPYAPFFIGAVAAAVELFLTPRSEVRARYHAAQGLVLQLAAIVIATIFNIVGNITGSSIGGRLFWAASTLFFIIATIRVWKGEAFHIAAVDDVARLVNERIEPQKTQKRK